MNTGLQAAINILSKWKCSSSQQRQILGMKKSAYYNYNDKQSMDGVTLSNDQLERISYILNMHTTLRLAFDNPENIYGFMAMQNFNPHFNGKAPLDLICSGNFGALYETFKRIDSLRNPI
jgi:hypothetical protein